MTIVELMLNTARERETDCRRRAAELHNLAITERDAELRGKLLALADRYEQAATGVVLERESISALL